MANDEHLGIINQGVELWNEWKEHNSDVQPNLDGAYLIEADLMGVNLSGASMVSIDLSAADLSMANLRGTNLQRAHLVGATLLGADLSKADLTRSNLGRANLTDANLSEATLVGASLQEAVLVQTNLEKANLSNCSVFGISAWDLILRDTQQSDLVITKVGQPIITVDNLEVAQFIYLLIHNEKLRDVIDTIGKKAVLILGRFTTERKAILDALREELREHNYIPILFDFEKPATSDLTETVMTLASLSRFIIADITDAKSIPQELQAIVPNLPSVVVQPIIHASQHAYAMFEHFKHYPWVLPLHVYVTTEQLLTELPDKIIQPIEDKVVEIRPKPSS